MAPKTVRIGVFIPTGAQLLDMACVDVFGSMSASYISSLVAAGFLPAHVAAAAPAVEICYITSAADRPAADGVIGPNSEGDATDIPLTAGARVRATHVLTDPTVRPGSLDVLLVPGPDPRDKWSEETLAFLKAHFDADVPGQGRKTDVLSVCTGIVLCGEAGILRGRKACGPRGMQKELQSRFGAKGGEDGVHLVGEDLRWTKDGNLWSSGGVTNGNDLVAAYCRDPAAGGCFFPQPVVELACRFCDVGDRPQKYNESTAAMSFSFVWLIIRAWWVQLGLGRKRD